MKNKIAKVMLLSKCIFYYPNFILPGRLKVGKINNRFINDLAVQKKMSR
jgi:hypothetical protein